MLLAGAAVQDPDEPWGPYFPPDFAKPTLMCGLRRLDFRLSPILSPFESAWYSRHLRAAGEPSLFAASQKQRAPTAWTMRFTWLPSFDAPVVVRIDRQEVAYHLIAKQLSGAGGYEPGSIAHRIDRVLTSDEVGQLQTIVGIAHLTRLEPVTCDRGADGAEWIIETVDAHGYHYVSRWSPTAGEVRTAGSLLLRLTGWRFHRIY